MKIPIKLLWVVFAGLSSLQACGMWDTPNEQVQTKNTTQDCRFSYDQYGNEIMLCDNGTGYRTEPDMYQDEEDPQSCEVETDGAGNLVYVCPDGDIFPISNTECKLTSADGELVYICPDGSILDYPTPEPDPEQCYLSELYGDLVYICPDGSIHAYPLPEVPDTTPTTCELTEVGNGAIYLVCNDGTYEQVQGPTSPTTSPVMSSAVLGSPQTEVTFDIYDSRYLIARLTTADGAPIQGINVYFFRTSGNASYSQEIITTGVNGIAQVQVSPANYRKAGKSVFRALVPGIPEVLFYVDIQPGPPSDIRVLSGNNQVTSPGQVLSDPIVVQLEDRYDNPIPGSVLRFGYSYNEIITETTTGPDGTAELQWTPGIEAKEYGAEVWSAEDSWADRYIYATVVHGPAANLVSVSNQRLYNLNERSNPPLTFQALDDYGNEVNDINLLVTAEAWLGLETTSITTDSNGEIEVYFTPGTSGVTNVTVSFDTLAITSEVAIYESTEASIATTDKTNYQITWNEVSAATFDSYVLMVFPDEASTVAQATALTTITSRSVTEYAVTISEVGVTPIAVVVRHTDTTDMPSNFVYTFQDFTLSVGSQIYDMVVSRDGRTAYLAMYYKSAIYKYDLISRTKTAEYATRSSPKSISLSKDESRLYVGHYTGGWIREITVATEEYFDIDISSALDYNSVYDILVVPDGSVFAVSYRVSTSYGKTYLVKVDVANGYTITRENSGALLNRGLLASAPILEKLYLVATYYDSSYMFDVSNTSTYQAYSSYADVNIQIAVDETNDALYTDDGDVMDLSSFGRLDSFHSGLPVTSQAGKYLYSFSTYTSYPQYQYGIRKISTEDYSTLETYWSPLRFTKVFSYIEDAAYIGYYGSYLHGVSLR